MNLRLASGSVRPASPPRNSASRFDVDERDIVMVAEQADDLLGLVRAHQPVIDEDAGQLVADRLVDQHRRHRAVDAARQAADHPALADLRADLGDLGVAELGHRPVAGQAADVADEIGEQLAAVRACGPPRGGTAGRRSAAPRRRPPHRARPRDAATTREAFGQAARPGRRGSSTPGGSRPASRGRRTGADSPMISMKARPNSRLSDGATVPPSWCAMVCWP